MNNIPHASPRQARTLACARTSIICCGLLATATLHAVAEDWVYKGENPPADLSIRQTSPTKGPPQGGVIPGGVIWQLHWMETATFEINLGTTTWECSWTEDDRAANEKRGVYYPTTKDTNWDAEFLVEADKSWWEFDNRDIPGGKKGILTNHMVYKEKKVYAEIKKGQPPGPTQNNPNAAPFRVDYANLVDCFITCVRIEDSTSEKSTDRMTAFENCDREILIKNHIIANGGAHSIHYTKGVVVSKTQEAEENRRIQISLYRKSVAGDLVVQTTHPSGIGEPGDNFNGFKESVSAVQNDVSRVKWSNFWNRGGANEIITNELRGGTNAKHWINSSECNVHGNYQIKHIYLFGGYHGTVVAAIRFIGELGGQALAAGGATKLISLIPKIKDVTTAMLGDAAATISGKAIDGALDISRSALDPDETNINMEFAISASITDLTKEDKDATATKSGKGLANPKGNTEDYVKNNAWVDGFDVERVQTYKTPSADTFIFGGQHMGVIVDTSFDDPQNKLNPFAPLEVILDWDFYYVRKVQFWAEDVVWKKN